jgi:hypothetical protein
VLRFAEALFLEPGEQQIEGAIHDDRQSPRSISIF